jgi:hypothetical protein
MRWQAGLGALRYLVSRIDAPRSDSSPAPATSRLQRLAVRVAVRQRTEVQSE